MTVEELALRRERTRAYHRAVERLVTGRRETADISLIRRLVDDGPADLLHFAHLLGEAE